MKNIILINFFFVQKNISVQRQNKKLEEISCSQENLNNTREKKHIKIE